MTTRHIKSFYVNSSNTSLTTSNGTKFDTPVFFYKDNILIQWNVVDSKRAVVDLTSSVFTFKINETYNGTNLLTVANSDFVAGDWSGWDISNGKICCRVDMNQAAIGTYINLSASETAQASLWVTLGGYNYCLATFEITIKNLIF